MPTEIDAATTLDRPPLFSEIEHRLADACRRLVALCSHNSAEGQELQDKFLPAISKINQVVIGPLEANFGAFVAIEDVLYLKEEPVIELFRIVLSDIASQLKAGRTISAAEIPALLERALMDYVLHELRHQSQGVGDYGDFKLAKSIAGRRFMAEMDVQADRDAAFAFSMLYTHGNSRAEFLECFREALFLSSAYYFRIFPPTPSRLDKQERVAAVMLMSARLAVIRDFNELVERPDLPLDSPLIAKISTAQSTLAIFQGQPNVRLLGAANDAAVGLLVRQLDRSQFDDALETSISLADQLGLLPDN
ncbi:MAG TPA: hypothetical protein VK533_09515 [Sphingomonas sp.]|uniref:hypothetical protein n=1 Tax=Sphingomonas sp. TaxID=28214 RepID=UPI002CC7DFAE|nr:hypothetical protein [Sphingomonas sp.]HMI19770.1 hypothetical protein [Sphingomonas sp.]